MQSAHATRLTGLSPRDEGIGARLGIETMENARRLAPWDLPALDVTD